MECSHNCANHSTSPVHRDRKFPLHILLTKELPLSIRGALALFVYTIKCISYWVSCVGSWEWCFYVDWADDYHLFCIILSSQWDRYLIYLIDALFFCMTPKALLVFRKVEMSLYHPISIACCSCRALMWNSWLFIYFYHMYYKAI